MRVSVGLPFFNNRRTLADAIRSVFAQSFEDWELILVDDGSTDGSLEIARSVRDPRVRVVSDGSNRGLAARLNQIAGLARAPLLARLDGDDMLHPQRLQRQVEVFDCIPGIDLVGTAMYSLDRADHPRGIQGLTQPDRRAAAVLQRALLLHATITGRTAWFRDNPYDEQWRRAEDRELMVRTFGRMNFVHLTEALYFCREEFSIRLDKYLASGRESRRIMRQYGPKLLGRAHTTALRLASWCKGEIYRLGTHLHAEQFLVRRRNRAIDGALARDAEDILRRIRTTPVPGLETSCEASSARIYRTGGQLPINECARRAVGTTAI